MGDSPPPLQMDYDFGAALDEFEVPDSASLPEDGFWLEEVGFKLGEVLHMGLELDQSEDVIVPSPGVAGVAEMLGADLPTRGNWSDPAWVRALYALPLRGVELASFQAWAARGVVAAEESEAVSGPGSPPDRGSMVKERVKGAWKASSETFSFPPLPPGSLETSVNVGGDSEGEPSLEVVTTVSLSKVASQKLWQVTSMRALAQTQEEA